jgi:predicted transcriptional regulator
MEVNLYAEKEARLQEFTARSGKNTAQLVEEAVDRMLDYETAFVAAVEQGRVSARQGNLLEHEEVVARIEQIFRS